MSPTVFFAVLLAAVLHASWNALVKSGGDKKSSIVAVMLGHVPPALVTLYFVPLPNLDVWPLLALSVFFHIGYPMALQAGYSKGDLSQVYPIARGTGPLIVTLISVVWLNEPVGLGGLLAILLMIIGIFSLGFSHRSISAEARTATKFAILTGCFIAGYSIVDALGSREGQSALGFFALSSILSASVFLVHALLFRRKSLSDLKGPTFKPFAIGGSASFAAYLIVCWAFTKAPIALVTALRESSMIVALLIGALFLGEGFTKSKLFATVITVTGVIAMRIWT